VYMYIYYYEAVASLYLTLTPYLSASLLHRFLCQITEEMRQWVEWMKTTD
jgi:hypothetical protein